MKNWLRALLGSEVRAIETLAAHMRLLVESAASVSPMPRLPVRWDRRSGP